MSKEEIWRGISQANLHLSGEAPFSMGMKKDTLSQVNDEVDHASNQQIVQELPALDVDTTAKEAKRESRLRRRTK